ncbi:MAG: hypothetical protein H0T73_07570 [Ardenticatenales bacterium]|nr:hypothetical protein [Ardenticatenales bacterium]
MDEMVQSDTLLLQQLRARHPLALEALYDRYAQTTYNLIWRMVDDPDLASELLVETFWQAWNDAPWLSEHGPSCGSWIYQLARQKSLQMIQEKSFFTEQVN